MSALDLKLSSKKLVSFHTSVVFKAGSKKHLVCFKFIIFLWDRTLLIFLYTNGMDTFVCHFPVQQALASTERRRVEHTDNSVGWQEMGEVLW